MQLLLHAFLHCVAGKESGEAPLSKLERPQSAKSSFLMHRMLMHDSPEHMLIVCLHEGWLQVIMPRENAHEKMWVLSCSGSHSGADCGG